MGKKLTLNAPYARQTLSSLSGEMVVKRRTLKGAAAVEEEEGVNTQDPPPPPTDLDSATTKPLSPQRGKGSTNSSPRQMKMRPWSELLFHLLIRQEPNLTTTPIPSALC